MSETITIEVDEAFAASLKRQGVELDDLIWAGAMAACAEPGYTPGPVKVAKFALLFTDIAKVAKNPPTLFKMGRRLIAKYLGPQPAHPDGVWVTTVCVQNMRRLYRILLHAASMPAAPPPPAAPETPPTDSTPPNAW